VKARWIALVMIFVLLVPACGPAKKYGGTALQFERRTIESKYGNCDSASAGCVSILVEYPEIARAGSIAARDSISAFVRGFVFATIERSNSVVSVDQLKEGLIAGYKKLQREFKDFSQQWVLERRARVALDSAGIVTVWCKEYSYLGGAHPNQVVQLGSFDASSGRKLEPGELFTAGYEAKLTSLAEREFRKVRQLATDQNLTEAGFWFENGEFALPKNVAVTAAGMTFYYNDYEVGPHVIGATEITLPFADLKEIIRKDGPLAALAGE